MSRRITIIALFIVVLIFASCNLTLHTPATYPQTSHVSHSQVNALAYTDTWTPSVAVKILGSQMAWPVQPLDSVSPAAVTPTQPAPGSQGACSPSGYAGCSGNGLNCGAGVSGSCPTTTTIPPVVSTPPTTTTTPPITDSCGLGSAANVLRAEAAGIPCSWVPTAVCEEQGYDDPSAGYFGIQEWNGFEGYPTAGSAPLSVQQAWEASVGQTNPPDAPGECASY